jgi:hypothetical protein
VVDCIAFGRGFDIFMAAFLALGLILIDLKLGNFMFANAGWMKLCLNHAFGRWIYEGEISLSV